MAKSTKRNPVIGFAYARSEKRDKIIANRKARINENIRLKKMGESYFPVDRKSYSDIWTFAKDGKQRLSLSSFNRMITNYGWLKWIKK